MSGKLVVGAEVSKDWLDLCWAAASERIANERPSVAAWLDRVEPGVVACEPTGGYERELVAALRERAIPFIRVHPNAVIAVRKSRGIKAKTGPPALQPHWANSNGLETCSTDDHQRHSTWKWPIGRVCAPATTGSCSVAATSGASPATDPAPARIREGIPHLCGRCAAAGCNINLS